MSSTESRKCSLNVRSTMKEASKRRCCRRKLPGGRICCQLSIFLARGKYSHHLLTLNTGIRSSFADKYLQATLTQFLRSSCIKVCSTPGTQTDKLNPL